MNTIKDCVTIYFLVNLDRYNGRCNTLDDPSGKIGIPNKTKGPSCSAAAVHDDNNEVSNDDFNTVMDKKLNEFKSSIISELIENMKVLIHSEFQNIMQEYKNQLEEINSTVAMLQQDVTDLKQENSNLQENLGIIVRIYKYCKENEQ